MIFANFVQYFNPHFVKQEDGKMAIIVYHREKYIKIIAKLIKGDDYENNERS